MTRECITLSNGLQLWLEQRPDRYTASFGIWAAAGSSMEQPRNNGVSHFLEHMYFKGSGTLNAVELAARMDAIGGQVDAYTTKEDTCFYARTLTEHVNEGFDLLCGMIAEPALTEENFRTERGVVLEEIGMAADDPEDAVAERLEQAIWRKSPYGMPILGTRETVERMKLKDLVEYRNRMYVPNRMAIAVTGCFDRDEILAQAEKRFGSMQPGEARIPPEPIDYQIAHISEYRELEQTHLCFALPTLPARHKLHWAMNMLNTAIGSSNSSRLFQRVREEMGLAYSVCADLTPYEGGGAMYVQAAVNPDQAQRAAVEIARVLREARNGITEKEFCCARERLKSSLRISMEDSMEQVSYAGSGAVVGEVLTDDELLAQVESVTLQDVNTLAETVFDLSRMSTSVCGPIEHPEFYENLSVE